MSSTASSRTISCSFASFSFGGGSELMHDGDTDGFRWLMDEAMRFVTFCRVDEF